MSETIYPISSIVKYIKSTLDQNPYLSGILIQGEISNLKKHRSGHWYFTLKDEQARLSCVMFASYALRCKAKVEDGSKVVIKGSISLYEQQGSIQCYVTAIRNDGIGDLYLRFEELKKKLFAEGWFDEQHKKKIPLYASDIGIISAKEGAALQDVLSTIQKHWPIAKLTLYPAYVQGAQASSSIMKALQQADRHHHDCLLLVRGGGSIEDLWGFNNEELVHCIYHLKTPIISGVGHESDTTLVDFVCDVRAATPTGAAQRATADIQEVMQALSAKQQLLSSIMKRRIELCKQQLSNRAQTKYLQDPLSFIKDQQMHLATITTRFERYSDAMQKKQSDLLHKNDLLFQAMRRHLLFYQTQTKLKKNSIEEKVFEFLNQQKQLLNRNIHLLDAYSPLSILKRGYTLVENEQHLIKNAEDLQAGAQISIRFHDGKWRARLLEKEENHG